MESEVRKHKYLPILIAVFVMLLVTTIAVGGVWYYMDQQAKKDKAAAAEETIQDLRNQINGVNNTGEETTVGTVSTTADWKTYTNSEYNFSIKYPSNFYVTVGGLNPDNTFSVYFQNVKYQNVEAESPQIGLTLFPKKATDLGLWIKNSPEYFTDVTDFAQSSIIDGYYFKSSGMVINENYATQNSAKTYAYVIGAPQGFSECSVTDLAKSLKIN